MNPAASPIQAIETHFLGYRFRSRLEARWAHFLNTLGVPFEYEKEGYDIGGTQYLPDFWLPTLDSFMEIKGQAPTVEERRRCQALASSLDKRVYLFAGPMEVPHMGGRVFYVGWEDDPAYWCRCPVCGKYGIEWNGRGMRICWHDPENDRAQTWRTAPIMEAFRLARSARFEFEEKYHG